MEEREIDDCGWVQEVIIMAFTCEQCGYRNNEIKGGGAIPAKVRCSVFLL